MTKPLRIAWVVYGSLDQISGGYIYDRLVAEELRRAGDQVSVVSLEPGGEVPRLSSADYDVVVGDELCFRELLPLFQACPDLRRVLLIHHLTAWEHLSGAERERLLAEEQAVIDAADACVATSIVTADRLQAEQLARRVRVAEPGADRMPRSGTAGQEPSGALLRLLFVGNLLPRKRVLELCDAFGNLSISGVELVLVGAEPLPDYARELRSCIERHGVRDRVRFLGALAAEAVAEQLSLADALVLPSLLEGYGMVLSEALWAGVPVIAARVGAAEQLVNRTSAGLLYEPDDDAALGASLTAFVADAQLRRRLRHAAWQAADVLPRWAETARSLRTTLLG